MEKPRIVKFMRLDRADRALRGIDEHNGPSNDRELRSLHQYDLDLIDDLVDDSLRFIHEELSRLGVSSDQVQATQQRFAYGLISSWAEWVINLRSADDPARYIYRDLTTDYFRHKFGRQFGARFIYLSNISTVRS